MIGYLRGKVLECSPELLLLDVVALPHANLRDDREQRDERDDGGAHDESSVELVTPAASRIGLEPASGQGARSAPPLS